MTQQEPRFGEQELRDQLAAAIEIISEREEWCLLPSAILEVIELVSGRPAMTQIVLAQREVS